MTCLKFNGVWINMENVSFVEHKGHRFVVNFVGGGPTAFLEDGDAIAMRDYLNSTATNLATAQRT